MTDFSYLRRDADQAFAEVGRLIERGDYYKDRNDTTQSLANYVDALKAYARYAEANTEALSITGVFAVSTNPNLLRIHAATLFDIAGIIANILGCYSNSVEKAFLEEKFQIISNELARYESCFDAKQLELYDRIRNLANKSKAHIESHQEAIEELKKKPIKELDDQQFAAIRSALSDISSTKVCPVRIDSTFTGCFIATAAYSTSTHPDLDTFRSFRDEKLLPHPLGKNLVTFYYKTGPSIAKYIEKQPALKQKLKHHLANLANWMRHKKITSR